MANIFGGDLFSRGFVVSYGNYSKNLIGKIVISKTLLRVAVELTTLANWLLPSCLTGRCRNYIHGVQRRMVSVDNFLVFLRLLIFAVLLLYET